MAKTKLTKRHFQYLAELINQCAKGQEKLYKDNIAYVGFRAHIDVHLNLNPYPVIGVREVVDSMHRTVCRTIGDKEFSNQFHERNSYIKELSLLLSAQNPLFNTLEFRKACLAGI